MVEGDSRHPEPRGADHAHASRPRPTCSSHYSTVAGTATAGADYTPEDRDHEDRQGQAPGDRHHPDPRRHGVGGHGVVPARGGLGDRMPPSSRAPASSPSATTTDAPPRRPPGLAGASRSSVRSVSGREHWGWNKSCFGVSYEEGTSVRTQLIASPSCYSFLTSKKTVNSADSRAATSGRLSIRLQVPYRATR